MTIEEIKNQLEELIKDRESFMVGDYDKDIYDRDKEALEFVVKAVEKQIPKKPNNIYCPICKRPLRKEKKDIGYTGKVKKRKADNYCPGCGQALDWSDKNG